MDKELPNLPPSLSPWSKAEISKFYYGALTDKIIAAAITVHYVSVLSQGYEVTSGSHH